MALSQPNLTTQTILNFQIPSNGQINALATSFPNVALSGGGTGYTIDFNVVAQLQGGYYFVPQACTIDATTLTTDVVFAIAVLDFKRVVKAGTGATFQFPAVQNAIATVTPNDGASTVGVVWYNYPALPDRWSN
jgi:hypothetical protein